MVEEDHLGLRIAETSGKFFWTLEAFVFLVCDQVKPGRALEVSDHQKVPCGWGVEPVSAKIEKELLLVVVHG